MPEQLRAADGTDCRNYGGLTGLLELREIFAPLLNVPVDQLVAGDNASLSIMHDTLVYSLLKGTVDSRRPGWPARSSSSVRCRATTGTSACASSSASRWCRFPWPDGPDLNQVQQLVADDPAVKGIWIVPTYANPNGAVYTEEVTRALVEMPAAAPDFRMFWDNAYAVHHLTEIETPALDILGLAEAAGNPNRVFLFASTSKITFAGAGVSFFASSPGNVAWYLQHLSKRTIGPDKVNHLRHARYLQSADGVRELMRRHREILAPKFALVNKILTERLGEHEAATWTTPDGGYFVSLDVADGTATRVVALAKAAGIAMTGAGAAFPYGGTRGTATSGSPRAFRPRTRWRRPIDGLSTCVLLAATEQLLGD